MRGLLLLFLSFLVLSCSENKTRYSLGEKVTIVMEGPVLSELSGENPFTDYRLLVTFTNGEESHVVRGFYAADGNAAETSADVGKVWKAHFLASSVGEWRYTASLQKGAGIAISEEEGKPVEISNKEGSFIIEKGNKSTLGAKGVLRVVNGYLQHAISKEHFIKVGANSPENFLAFQDFDQTYRIDGESREGESKTNAEIHGYADHVSDWQEGDPTWQNGKGKGIIGAVNYLASKGMNSIYFLTFNTTGDGRDVWMYTSPTDFSRFDVSKLEQWEILFSHMEKKGILMHVVLQETENEALLDGGDTGPDRKLYLLEFIARFGHHPGLIWNIGEENGPNNWSKNGSQTDEQRKAMIAFLEENDPYGHAITIHTLPNNPSRDEILNPLTDVASLDGISLQDHLPAEVNGTVKDLRRRSNGKWYVAMDEIGPWHTGALADTATENHETLQREVLWGSLLAGAGGVEWYFGAKQTYNDLTSESWKVRDHLWTITNYAKTFFQENLPFWEMTAMDGLVKKGYAFGKKEEVYVFYLFGEDMHSLNLKEITGTFSQSWYNPNTGEWKNSPEEVVGGKDLAIEAAAEDWVLLLKRKP